MDVLAVADAGANAGGPSSRAVEQGRVRSHPADVTEIVRQPCRFPLLFRSTMSATPLPR